MATVVSGARTTGAGIVSTRLVLDVKDLHKLEPEETPLVSTVALLKKERGKARVRSWHVSELRPKFDRINEGAGYASGDTSLTVDNGAYFRINDQVKVTRTKEVMRVTGVSSNTLTVTRSWGATAAAAIVDNDELLIVSPAYDENDQLEAVRSVTEVQYSNKMQIFRHNWSFSGSLEAVSDAGGTYGGKDPEIQRQDKLLEHKRDINLAFLHGEVGASTTIQSMDGIIPFIETNATGNTDATATLTETAWNSGLKNAFRYGKQKKIAIASRAVAGIVNEYASSVQRTSPGDSSFGLRLTKYTSPHGDLSLMTDHGLEGDQHDKTCIILDPSRVAYVYLRDTKLLKNRQAVDIDGTQEELLTECTAEWGEPRTHYLFNAVTG